MVPQETKRIEILNRSITRIILNTNVICERFPLKQNIFARLIGLYRHIGTYEVRFDLRTIEIK